MEAEAETHSSSRMPRELLLGLARADVAVGAGAFPP